MPSRNGWMADGGMDGFRARGGVACLALVIPSHPVIEIECRPPERDTADWNGQLGGVFRQRGLVPSETSPRAPSHCGPDLSFGAHDSGQPAVASPTPKIMAPWSPPIGYPVS